MHNELSATLLAAMMLSACVNMNIFLELLGTARRPRVSHDHSCLLASGYRLVVVPTIPRNREYSIISMRRAHFWRFMDSERLELRALSQRLSGKAV